MPACKFSQSDQAQREDTLLHTIEMIKERAEFYPRQCGNHLMSRTGIVLDI